MVSGKDGAKSSPPSEPRDHPNKTQDPQPLPPTGLRHVHPHTTKQMKSTAQSEGKQTSPDESQQKQSNSDLEPDQSAVRGIIPSAKAITVVAVLLAVLSVIALILVTWMGAHGPEIILEGLAKIVSGVLIAVSSAVLIGQISTAD